MSEPLAVITGASSGIGAEFARQLRAQGYRLLLIARREDKLRELAAALGASEVLAADLANEQSLETAAAEIARRAPDMLVNNAGFGLKGRFWESPLAPQMEMHRLHVLATVRLTHAVLPAMVERNSGAIINVSSVAGFARSPGNVSYCATKGWMNDFTEGLRLELAGLDSRVRVQALCPGFTYSEFHDVMGVSRSNIAKSMWLKADFVVSESLRGLERGKLFVVPDWRYRAFAAVFSKLPAALRVALEARSPHRKNRV